MIYTHIASLIEKGIEVKLIESADHIYVRNQVMHQLGLPSFPEHSPEVVDASIPDLLERIIDWAVSEQVIENVLDEKEILSANIMNCFVARPSVIQHHFDEKYRQSPVAATDYFYELSKNSNYIQMNRISKNIHFKADSAYGDLDITINLSKPEKDPEQIRREREMKQTVNYPKCLLCVENEGYNGRTGHPARANHRIIQVPLQGENWYLQYSPYVYYNEHSILLAEEHRNMKIDLAAFQRLLSFTEKFPHYFIGSNADLPIVGGSILSHDHYQAGRYEFAMTNAEHVADVTLSGFPDVRASILKWPLSVIRLQGDDPEQLANAGEHILNAWKNHSDEAAAILAYTDGVRHNTITPIARRRGDKFELDLVLRNNRTTEKHPMGIFHPHADVHHIKKENIGLIEVMGLAVLPARLKEELAELKKFLLGEASDVATYHQEWADQLKQEYGTVSDKATVDTIVEKELGKKFARVLEDAGVYKQTASGLAAFQRFIDAVNK
ncbi:UDP-glucose--hexose-1-phosphate uridylyltransferase [Virgibacillus halodenitrificans]|uniref:Galactose-1-phosphate uridylyltransferase n=1 Tax=Virgibacillus halodenitrificans TaxID=1482 RepID=A0ABR7VHE8_VIRHA|nr:UDP-glucose--hexose-1-phosphate uridylyltransferase [Virgibacillus halodenitrificans]MBD1221354.1 UDP-glucose--hexose-1-phosphate uridylyltransferase [Virgibacillus halodenitrificans]